MWNGGGGVILVTVNFVNGLKKCYEKGKDKAQK